MVNLPEWWEKFAQYCKERDIPIRVALLWFANEFMFGVNRESTRARFGQWFATRDEGVTAKKRAGVKA